MLTRLGSFLQIVLLLWACAGVAWAETAMQASVTQRGITWVFDREYQVGKFANGDYWVLGPVTITRITPDFDGQNNGWEVNPVVKGGHGFQAGPGFDPALVPKLPYTTQGIVSIVKTTPPDLGQASSKDPAAEEGPPSGGKTPGKVLIKSAAVLTVVEEVPPGDGALVFRPPYVGTEKPFYRVADLKTDLLPSLAPVGDMPSLESVEKRFSTLQMNHKSGNVGRFTRPQESMADYQPKNTADQNNAALRLMMNDPLAAKMPALVQFVQFGIDKIHTIYLGQIWPDGGGHEPGHRIVAAFAAVLLDLPKAKAVLQEADFFHGSRWFYRGEGGVVLWGCSGSEKGYWDYIMGKGGNRSNKDPYDFIDGGNAPGGAYQVITSQSHKGEILATHLMPALKEAWNTKEWVMLKEYTDRWVTVGLWTQPDPLAPYDGKPENLGISFGPDPKNPGKGILGTGRFPAAHGKFKDGGQYRSPYVAAMWDAYRAKAAE